MSKTKFLDRAFEISMHYNRVVHMRPATGVTVSALLCHTKHLRLESETKTMLVHSADFLRRILAAVAWLALPDRLDDEKQRLIIVVPILIEPRRMIRVPDLLRINNTDAADLRFR